MKLVGMNTTRYAQHVRDVLRAGAGRARGREGSTAQTNERPIPVLTREEQRRAPTTSHCRPAHPGRRGGKKLLGPGEVLVFLRREHREDGGGRPQKRVEHVTRSPATKRAQVSSSTPEPSSKGEAGVRSSALRLETAQQPCARVQKDHCSRPGQKLVQGPAAAYCRNKKKSEKSRDR